MMIERLRLSTRFVHYGVLAAGMVALLAAEPVVAKGKPQPPPPPPPPAPPVRYDITWFNTGSEYENIRLHMVNRSGTTAVGSTTTGGVSTAITINVATAAFTDLNSVVPMPAGWHLNAAEGITNSGQIAGTATDNLGIQRTYVYNPSDLATPFRALSTTGTGDQFRDMNEAGDVLFHQNDVAPKVILYTSDDQTYHVLPSSLGTEQGGAPGSPAGATGPTALNNSRQIAGNVEFNSDTTAYLYDYTTGITTPIPSYFRSIEINNGGTVVGRGDLKGKGTVPAKAITFTVEDGKTVLYSHQASRGTAINDGGQAAGNIYYVDASGPGNTDTDGFLYTPTAGFWPLDKLIDDPQDVPYWLSDPSTIFNLNVGGISEPLPGSYPLIVGDKLIGGAMFPDGMEHRLGFILTPISTAMSSALVAGAIPEPSCMLLTATAFLYLIARPRRRWFG